MNNLKKKQKDNQILKIEHDYASSYSFIKKKRATNDSEDKANKFDCQRCSRTYRSISALKTHIKLKHKDEVILHKKFKIPQHPKKDESKELKSIFILKSQTLHFDDRNDNFHLSKELKNFEHDNTPFNNLNKVEDYIKVIESTHYKKKIYNFQESKQNEINSVSKKLSDIIHNTYNIIYKCDDLTKPYIENFENLVENEESSWNEYYSPIKNNKIVINSISQYIQSTYSTVNSYENIMILNKLNSKLVLKKLSLGFNSIYTIDDVIIGFFDFNISLINPNYLQFLLNLQCLLREFINLRYYLLYDKRHYCSFFSAEILPKLCFEFLEYLNKSVSEYDSKQIIPLDKDLLSEKLRIDRFVIPSKVLTNLVNYNKDKGESLIRNSSKFIEVTKPKIRKSRISNGLSQQINSSVSSNNFNLNHDDIIRNSISITTSSKKASLLSMSSNSKSAIKEFKEVFFFIDFFCLWLNKNNHSSMILGA